jgi:hypothetical protein
MQNGTVPNAELHHQIVGLSCSAQRVALRATREVERPAVVFLIA